PTLSRCFRPVGNHPAPGDDHPFPPKLLFLIGNNIHLSLGIKNCTMKMLFANKLRFVCVIC
ncbi:hypothetical protein, partial [Vineibacter terrae]|uniref:hypothetical protein n=1 Tax=Vineibacter terrae TaxID=2586908 RepID=UPI002E33BAC8